PRRLDAAVGPRGLSCLASDQEHIDINVAAPRRASVAVLAQYLRASDPPPISKARPGVGSVASVGPCNSDAAASCFRTGILSSRCDQRHRPAVRLMASTLSALPFLTVVHRGPQWLHLLPEEPGDLMKRWWMNVCSCGS
ncbi:unnamed protein product, partial [Prorocentrum cordatum]